MDNQDGAIVRRLRKIPFSGIILAAFSAVCFSVASFTIKLIPGVPSLEIVVSRSIMQLVAYLPVALFSGSSLSGAKGDTYPLLMKCFIGFVCTSSGYVAISMIPLGDASTIIFSAPVYVSVFAFLILGEAFGILQFVVVCITIAGAGLISKPTFIFGSSESAEVGAYLFQGYVLAFVSSVANALDYVFTRKVQRTPADVVIVWYSAISTLMGILTIAGTYFMFDTDIIWPTEFTQLEWLILLANGACGIIGQLTLIVSLKLEEAGLVALTRCTDIVIAFILQILFLAEPIEWTSALGAVIVMSGVAISCIRKVIAERRAKALLDSKERSH
ncbi:Solute carrier family 35 member G1 [Halotydeus destructor]|nr:Solute carrier family 35 member G1 [Halotydeus destructor]